MFSDPVYPIRRNGDVYKHRIDLVDPAQPVPRKKIYPLSQEELNALRT